MGGEGEAGLERERGSMKWRKNRLLQKSASEQVERARREWGMGGKGMKGGEGREGVDMLTLWEGDEWMDGKGASSQADTQTLGSNYSSCNMGYALGVGMTAGKEKEDLQQQLQPEDTGSVATFEEWLPAQGGRGAGRGRRRRVGSQLRAQTFCEYDFGELSGGGFRGSRSLLFDRSLDKDIDMLWAEGESSLLVVTEAREDDDLLFMDVTGRHYGGRGGLSARMSSGSRVGGMESRLWQGKESDLASKVDVAADMLVPRPHGKLIPRAKTVDFDEVFSNFEQFTTNLGTPAQQFGAGKGCVQVDSTPVQEGRSALGYSLPKISFTEILSSLPKARAARQSEQHKVHQGPS